MDVLFFLALIALAYLFAATSDGWWPFRPDPAAPRFPGGRPYLPCKSCTADKCRGVDCELE